MANIYTCADIRRLLTKGDWKNPAIKQHVAQCADCLAFGRKHVREKKQAEAAGVEMKPDPKLLAAQMVAMSDEPKKPRKQIPRWAGVAIGLAAAGLILLMLI